MKTYNLNACDSNEALTLATDILRAGKVKRLHPAIGRALARVRTTRDALRSARVARRSADDGGSAGVGGAVAAVRSVFAGLADAVEARAGIAVDEDLVLGAKRVYATVFPEGTGFLNGTAADLEVECADVLDRAGEPGIATALEEMGCGPLLGLGRAKLAGLHAARQGVALARPHPGPDGLGALTDVLAALRAYAEVVQAVEVVEGSSLRDELLAPLENRRVPRRDPAPTADAPGADPPQIEEVPPSRAA